MLHPSHPPVSYSNLFPPTHPLSLPAPAPVKRCLTEGLIRAVIFRQKIMPFLPDSSGFLLCFHSPSFSFYFFIQLPKYSAPFFLFYFFKRSRGLSATRAFNINRKKMFAVSKEGKKGMMRTIQEMYINCGFL